MSSAEGADGGMDGNNIEWFLYREGQAVPRDVTHARIDPSVKFIAEGAFKDCEQLEEVELCEGLAIIGDDAFFGCKSLIRFKAPSTVKKIDYVNFGIYHVLWYDYICGGR